MRLFCASYQSPLDKQGTLNNVYIEDVEIRHKRFNQSLSIIFEMYYFKNDKRVLLNTKELFFFGMENSEFSSNKTLFVEIANPDYNILIEDSQEKLRMPLFVDGNYSFDIQNIPFEVVEYGYPTYEKVLQYFQGGTFENPEIIITEPLALGFIENKLIFNDEAVKIQFNFI